VQLLRDKAADQLNKYYDAEKKEILGNKKQLKAFIIIQVGHLFYVEELMK
jgi:hypothetical protein